MQLKKDGNPIMIHCNCKENRGKPCLHKGRIWAIRDRNQSHDWVPLALPSSKTGTAVMRVELMGEFRLESSLSLSGPVDLSETNNEWISLMNKPNSTHDRFIKKFQLRNGHYRASTPTWMDPDYGLHFDPIDWKNESERPYITVSGSTERVMVGIPQLENLDIVPNSRSKIRDSWSERCSEASSFMSYATMIDASRCDFTNLKKVCFNQTTGLEVAMIRRLTRTCSHLEELSLSHCPLSDTSLFVSSKTIKTLKIDFCLGLRFLYIKLPMVETLIVSSQLGVDIFDDLMPGNLTFEHMERRKKMTAEEKLDAEFDATFDVDIYPRNSEIRNTVEDICLVGYKFMDMDLSSFLFCPKLKRFALVRLKRLEEQIGLNKLLVLFKRNSMVSFCIVDEKLVSNWVDTWNTFRFSWMFNEVQSLNLLTYSDENLVAQGEEGALCNLKELRITVISSTYEEEDFGAILGALLNRFPHLESLYIKSDPQNNCKSLQFQYKNGESTHQGCNFGTWENRVKKIIYTNLTEEEERQLGNMKHLEFELGQSEEVLDDSKFLWEQVKDFAKRVA